MTKGNGISLMYKNKHVCIHKEHFHHIPSPFPEPNVSRGKKEHVTTQNTADTNPSLLYHIKHMQSSQNV